jgi:N-methylhydantoinase A
MGIQQLRKQRVRKKDMRVEWSADLRYDGQSWELNIPLSNSGPLEIEEIRSHFHKAHQKAYSYSDPGEMLEFVNLRVRVKGRTPAVVLSSYPDAPTPLDKAEKERRTVWLETGPTGAPVYDRARIGAKTTLVGPCLIEERVSTTFIPQGCSCVIDEYMNLVITVEDFEDNTGSLS